MGLINDVVKRYSFRFDFVLDGTLGLSGASEDTRIVTEGLLSDAQLESVALAGQAHERHLAALYRIGAGWETVYRVDRESDEDGDALHAGTDDGDDSADDNEPLSSPVRFRRGWMLGDGTECRRCSGAVCRTAAWRGGCDRLRQVLPDWEVGHDRLPVDARRCRHELTTWFCAGECDLSVCQRRCSTGGRRTHPTIFGLLVVATEKLRDGPDKGNLLLMSDHAR